MPDLQRYPLNLRLFIKWRELYVQFDLNPADALLVCDLTLPNILHSNSFQKLEWQYLFSARK